ncbi:MAG TPA: PBP1A family penicillin-binding protein, partial [Elusimicrobiota bacterium]|nr:PBP1A family penicillin-binding protein [Elusimicrobiota bacterium]
MSRTRFYLLAALAFLAVGTGSWMLRKLLLGLPPMAALEDYSPSLTTRVYDVKGNVIAELSIEKRALLPLSKIPVDLQSAVMATEDDNFMHHWGVSPKGMIRSALRDFVARRVVQGASTITQQLAKQVFLKPERKFSRKIREVLLAVEIEHTFSKQEILQFYLNQVYFGEGAYGAQAAARNYFGKDLPDLSLADCALLAGLIRAPRANSPFFNPENARRRRAVVLQRMYEEHMITSVERDDAAAAPIPVTRPVGLETQAPFFVEHVRRRLEQKYGTAAVWRGGLKIYTTLDLDVEKKAEEIMEKSLSGFDARVQAERDKKLKDLAASGAPLPPDVSTAPLAKIQGAFVLMDVKTGAVRAMIGGRDSHFNRVIQAKRQPGSTFKPFVWAAALESGMTPASLVDDTPLAFYFDGRDWRLLEGATDQYSINLATQPFAASPDFKIWVPNNFDGKFMGRVTLRTALAHSRNIASINLITQVGPPLVVEIARRAGIHSDLEPSPALALGASDVTPMEMTAAFGAFANGGVAVTPYTVERVEDSTGRVLESHVPSDREAMTPQIAYLVADMMKGVVQNGTGQGAKRLGRPLAGKTGTSNDNRDLWFIGYTPDLVATAWMGYDDFSTLGRKDWTGGTTVLPWWTDIMAYVLKDMPKRDFPVPPGITFATIDSQTGLLFGPNCPRKNKLLEAFATGTQPTKYCNLDHSKSIADQLEKEEAPPAPEGTVLPPETSASSAAAASPAATPAAAGEPP